MPENEAEKIDTGENEKDQILCYVCGLPLSGNYDHSQCQNMGESDVEKLFNDGLYSSYVEFLEKFEAELLDGLKKDLIKDDDSADVMKQKNSDFYFFVRTALGAGRYPPPLIKKEEVEAKVLLYKEAKEFTYSLPPEFKPDNITRGEIGEITGGKGAAAHELNSRMPNMLSYSQNPENFKIFFQIFKDCYEKTDPILAQKFLDVIADYARNHNLTEQSIKGFEDKLLPALRDGDSQVEVLKRSGNIWGMEKGDFGIADFVCCAYGSEANPKDINLLLMALREVPTTNLSKLEQNRKDAFILCVPFGALRDLIHDQNPFVHKVVKAMLDYYTTNDKSELLRLLPLTKGYLGPQSRQDEILDLGRYNEEVVDTLKRVEKNTQPVEEIPPVTSDEELNKMMNELSEKDSVWASLLEKAFDRVNSYLESMQDRKEVGIEPNMVLAIAWLERQGHRAIKEMPYEDQVSAYKMSWFHSTLEFQELTSSAHPFDKKDFEEFTKNLSGIGDYKEAYKLVMERVLKNISGLSDIYRQSGKPDIIGALWSGNLTHELIALVDPKETNSTYWKRYRKEQETPLDLRNTGD